MIDWDEPEVRAAMHAWNEAQTLLAGAPGPDATLYSVSASWYDSDVDEHSGAFALVLEGGALEDLVGDVVQVEYGEKRGNVYVYGASPDLATDFALQRSAMIRFAPLYKDEIPMNVRVVA